MLVRSHLQRRHQSAIMRFMFFLPALAVFSAAQSALHAQAVDPAHALAQKFAIESQPDIQKRASKAKPAPIKSAVSSQAARGSQNAPPPSAEYEQEMLAAARAEAEARAQAAKVEPALVVTTEPRAATPVAAPMQIKIEAKIKAPYVGIRTAEAQSAKPASPAKSDGRATVLLVLSHTPEQPSSVPRTFDPILCVKSECYISTGPNSDARPVPESQALSTKNAITSGAGACAGKSQCTFRGIEISANTQLEIVDLGLVRHDRRRALNAKIDQSCRLVEGDLTCDHPLTAPDYRVWIVPEDVAKSAGPEELEAALDDELPEPDIALDTDK